jgi:hypothetical protein
LKNVRPSAEVGPGYVLWLMVGLPGIVIAICWASVGFPMPSMPPMPGWPALAAALWLGMGGLTGWLASQRGRSAPAWFALGLALGPFALLAVGLAPVRGSGR